jgi:hypothetical protein
MPNAKFMMIDIKDFYLMTPMDRFEYFRMKLDLFPQNIIDENDLTTKWTHMAMCSAKYDEECTDSIKPES